MYELDNAKNSNSITQCRTDFFFCSTERLCYLMHKFRGLAMLCVSSMGQKRKENDRDLRREPRVMCDVSAHTHVFHLFFFQVKHFPLAQVNEAAVTQPEARRQVWQADAARL